MIRGLRRRHRLIWVVLFPVVTLLLVVALLSRPEPPLMDELPTPREDAAEPTAAPENPPPGDEGP